MKELPLLDAGERYLNAAFVGYRVLIKVKERADALQPTFLQPAFKYVVSIFLRRNRVWVHRVAVVERGMLNRCLDVGSLRLGP